MHCQASRSTRREQVPCLPASQPPCSISEQGAGSLQSLQWPIGRRSFNRPLQKPVKSQSKSERRLWWFLLGVGQSGPNFHSTFNISIVFFPGTLGLQETPRCLYLTGIYVQTTLVFLIATRTNDCVHSSFNSSHLLLCYCGAFSSLTGIVKGLARFLLKAAGEVCFLLLWFPIASAHTP